MHHGMKYFILFLLSTTAYAQCSTTPFPFQTAIKLNPNQCVEASYNFTDPTGTHPLIFCYQSNPQKNATLNWPYKGSIQSANMPTTLKTSSIYSGEFADSQGTLIVTNASKVAMYVVCQYAF